MSGKLPVISGQEAVRIFERLGYQVVRQRGSHIRLRHGTDPQRKPTTVPDQKTIKPGTLRAILRDANLSVEEFRELL